MDEDPPSYQEAVGPYDIMAIIAPYIYPSDYNAACLVDKHIHSHFAPLLWKDPIRMIRTLGLKRDNGMNNPPPLFHLHCSHQHRHTFMS